jgi:hypothetical protein
MKNSTLAFVCLLLSGFTVFQFCVKPPDYPKEPVIEFKSLSKTQMFQDIETLPDDSILLTFTYTDGDGDIGSKGSDSTSSLFFVDQRDNRTIVPAYRLPFIEPQGTGNGISGEISVRLGQTCCIYIGPGGIPQTCEDVPIFKDTVVYAVYIRDRAGHESNRILTPPITLICK